MSELTLTITADSTRAREYVNERLMEGIGSEAELEKVIQCASNLVEFRYAKENECQQ